MTKKVPSAVTRRDRSASGTMITTSQPLVARPSGAKAGSDFARGDTCPGFR